MTARNRVAMAARWLKVASGFLQFHARRRALIVAMVDAKRADEDMDERTDDQRATRS